VLIIIAFPTSKGKLIVPIESNLGSLTNIKSSSLFVPFW
jgi:hypothetical protein